MKSLLRIFLWLSCCSKHKFKLSNSCVRHERNNIHKPFLVFQSSKVIITSTRWVSSLFIDSFTFHTKNKYRKRNKLIFYTVIKHTISVKWISSIDHRSVKIVVRLSRLVDSFLFETTKQHHELYASLTGCEMNLLISGDGVF